MAKQREDLFFDAGWNIWAELEPRARDRERHLIRRALADSVPDAGMVGDTTRVEVIQALVEGLTSACTLGTEPMTPARAVRLLRYATEAILGGSLSSTDVA